MLNNNQSHNGQCDEKGENRRLYLFIPGLIMKVALLSLLSQVERNHFAFESSILGGNLNFIFISMNSSSVQECKCKFSYV